MTEQGLRALGFRDAVRAVLGWEAKERSWTYPNGGGYRLDHVLARGAEVTAAAYAHGLREAGLSDHSALARRPRLQPASTTFRQVNGSAVTSR